MMSGQTWSNISVYDFFRTYNWTGENTEIEGFNSLELEQTSQSLLSLNLKDFLEKSNWRGDKKVLVISQLNQPLLTLSVNNFFQRVQWQNSQKIAPTSNHSSFTPPNEQTSSDLDLNNLSDLF